MDEILMLQEEIRELQAALAEELVSEAPESDPAEQLALQSTLTVLAEQMSTIKMKAAGKRQLLEVTSHPEGALPPAPPRPSLTPGLAWTSLWAASVIAMFIALPRKKLALCREGPCEQSPVSVCSHECTFSPSFMQN